MVGSKTPQSLINLAHEVVEWMDGQRDAQFPFCDTYLMWNYSSSVPDSLFVLKLVSILIF